mmetsp:Transcript_16418/g.40167  ORF Transcript_16418/g.40167 Transcript_16418/m.40167 type:complete len:293 (+) Transcript_16418:474-1352(+)
MVRAPVLAMNRHRVHTPVEAWVTKLEPELDSKSQSVHVPVERYTMRNAPPFVAPLRMRLLASSLPALCATSKIPPRPPALIVHLLPALLVQAPMMRTVVRFTAGSSQSPKLLPVPWKPQSQLGISPPEQSSYRTGTDARLMSAVMVMTSVTPTTCAERASESWAAVVTVKAAGGGKGGGGEGGGGLGGGGGYVSSTTVTTLKELSDTSATPTVSLYEEVVNEVISTQSVVSSLPVFTTLSTPEEVLVYGISTTTGVENVLPCGVSAKRELLRLCRPGSAARMLTSSVSPMPM